VLSMCVLRSASAVRTARSGPALAAEELVTGHDPISVARFRQPVLTAAQRVLLPLAVVGTAAATHAAGAGRPAPGGAGA